MLIDSKSNLARLMATENLVIEQRRVPTAFFDIKNRVLTVPILNGNLSPELYDLLLGHEVGHALETPEEGWHHSVIEVKEVSTSLVFNIDMANKVFHDLSYLIKYMRSASEVKRIQEEKLEEKEQEEVEKTEGLHPRRLNHCMAASSIDAMIAIVPCAH
jgi:hypothetical protein